jgi:DNA (cytosine-5)-methyltransferase 1
MRIRDRIKELRRVKASDLLPSPRNWREQLLNAKYYGVPQERQRLIFIGVREDLGIEPSHPQARTKPITVRQAFSGLDLTNSRTLDEARWRYDPAKYAVARLVKFCRAGEGADKYHPRGSYFNSQRIPWNAPSQTILRKGGGGESCLMHPVETRCLCEEELKRLATFPDSFQFVGRLKLIWTRIGNSVPPQFMRAIAEHIRDEVLARVNRG